MRKKRENMKLLMWERLSRQGGVLELDWRTEEEPEDLFVRLYHSGQKEDVIWALNANLCEVATVVRKGKKEDALQFMHRAIRLCDILGAYDCKPVLKLILLQEPSDYWGDDLEELQELASRALDGMPKETSEFEYWRHLAQRQNRTLPYALNALMEINLDRGVEVVCQTYFELAKTKRESLVDFEAIFRIAAGTYGTEGLSHALDKAFAGRPIIYEAFVRRVAKMPSLTRVGQRSLDDIAEYGAQIVVKPKKTKDTKIEASILDYPTVHIESEAGIGLLAGKKLTASYATVGEPSDMLTQLKAQYKWRLPSPKVGN